MAQCASVTAKSTAKGTHSILPITKQKATRERKVYLVLVVFPFDQHCFKFCFHAREIQMNDITVSSLCPSREKAGSWVGIAAKHLTQYIMSIHAHADTIDAPPAARLSAREPRRMSRR